MKKGRIPFFSERKTTRENYKMSFTKTYILSLVMIGFLGIYYVWTLNINATKGYTIRNLEIQRRDLVLEENLLNMKTAEIQSLDNIASDPSILTMINADNPKYLVLKDINMAFISNGNEQ